VPQRVFEKAQLYPPQGVFEKTQLHPGHKEFFERARLQQEQRVLKGHGFSRAAKS
jgi:hypothetical protein